MKKSIYTLALMLVLIPAIAGAQFNINAPTGDAELGNWGEINSIAIQGDYAYLTDGEVGMHVVDLSDPDNLTEVAVLKMYGYSMKVVVQGDYAFVVDMVKGLQIVDITDPESPKVVRGIELDSKPNDIVVDGNFAYISGENGSLEIVEIIDPADPHHLSSTYGIGFTNSIEVDGDYAYLSGYFMHPDVDPRMGVRIIDISDPSSPIQASELFFDPLDTTIDMDVSDGFIYMSYGQAITVIDVQVADEPIEMVSVPTSPGIVDVMISGDHAFVVNLDGLNVFDITNHAQPFLSSRFEIDPLLSEDSEIAVSGDFAYITDVVFGLVVVDISEVWVEEFENEDARNALNVRPDDAAVLRVATLKAYPNPFNPLLTAAVNLPDQSNIRISLFNQLGQEVAVLADGNYAAGEQNFTLNASKMATGNYYLRAVGTGGLNEVQSVTLMK